MKLLPQYAESLAARIEWLSGLAPVQAEGTIAGLPFYFRARHDKWDLSICAKPDGNPVLVQQGWDDGYHSSGPYGSCGGEEASYMPHLHARYIIQEMAQIFIENHV